MLVSDASMLEGGRPGVMHISEKAMDFYSCQLPALTDAAPMS
jgi:hypothetical protein